MEGFPSNAVSSCVCHVQNKRNRKKRTRYATFPTVNGLMRRSEPMDGMFKTTRKIETVLAVQAAGMPLSPNR